jgi:hypothetical protein
VVFQVLQNCVQLITEFCSTVLVKLGCWLAGLLRDIWFLGVPGILIRELNRANNVFE